jgi:hypothetical protein
MVVSPAGLGTKNDCGGEIRQRCTCLLASFRLQMISLISVTLYIMPSSIKMYRSGEPRWKHISELTDRHNTGYELFNYLFAKLQSLRENKISKSVNKMKEQIQLIGGQTATLIPFYLLIHSMASRISNCVRLWLRINSNIVTKQRNNPFIYHSQK